MTARPDPTGPASEVHPGRVLGALSEPTRLRVLAAVVLAPGSATSADIGALAGVPAKRVAAALGTLAAAGLVRPTATGRAWEALPSTFGTAGGLVARMRPTVDPEDLGATPEEAIILRGFLIDGRLTALPVTRAKRGVVLNFVVQRFEPGRRYEESEVNQVLRRLGDDHATLRRSLVDEGLLEREDGSYWRAGGTFDVDRQASGDNQITASGGRVTAAE